MKRTAQTLLAALLAFGPAGHFAQTPAAPAPLTESGKVHQGNRTASFVIHLLPPSSFPDLPAPVADLLDHHACMVPQTYDAHRPENLVHASFERAGSSDWAVLCADKGTVSLLVVFASAPDRVTTLATAPETDRLQAHDPSGVLGFNWSIDPASPDRVHDAQAGMAHRPAPINHDALADSAIEQHTVFHFYTQGRWILLDLPE
jgi:hypothetical protein